MLENSAKTAFKHYSRKLVNNGFAMTAVALMALSLPVAYTNCSAKFGFEASDDSKLASLNSSGVIVINNGNDFTNSDAVTLSISHVSAEQMYVTNDPTCETGGSWQSVAASLPWTLANKNSSASVHVKFSNDGDGGVTSGCVSDAIVHDDLPPTLSVTTAPPAFTNAGSVAAVFASQDSGSGVDQAICEVGTGAAANECTPSGMSLVSPAEGSHSYTIEVRDRAGNVSDPSMVSFVVDRTAPTVTLNMTPSRISNQVRSEFRFSGSDAGSGVEKFECRMGAAATFASLPFVACPDIIVENLAAGAMKFEVKAIDRAGNPSAVASYDWTIDLTAPTVMITKMPSSYSNQVNSAFEFSGTDDGGALASYECKLDAATYVACTSPHNVTNLSEGSHTFSVVGIDVAGNRSSPASYTWTVDTTLPTISIATKPDAITNSTSATFSLIAADAGGIDLIECQLNDGAYAPCTATSTYNNLVDGDRSFRARAKDRAGNTSAVAAYTWKIDTSKPTATITTGPDRWIKIRAATLSFTGADVNVATGLPALQLQCKINDGTFAACTSPTAYSGLNEGSYLFTLRAVDAAGNISNEATNMWGVDLTPPSINFGRQPLSIVYRGESAEIFYAVTDPGTSASGVASVMCGLNDVLATCTAENTKKYNLTQPGNYKFSVVAKDNAGNESKNSVEWQVSDKFYEQRQLIDVRRLTKIDVLVVIDNSGSMKTEHENMAARFGTFLDQLNGLDWRVGIVTTDAKTDVVKGDGKLVEFLDKNGNATSTYMIDSRMNKATAQEWFAKTIQMPTNGSGDEQGIAMTYRAIQRAQNNSGTDARNYALFRADAALAVLVTTDADETNRSGTQNQNKPEFVLNYIKTVYPGKPFSYHSIIVPLGDSVCVKQNGNEGYGYSYDAMSRLTGGSTGTVCASDYGSQLTAIGQATQDLVRSVALACAPVDTNADGMPEMQIVTSNGSTAPAFTITGMRINFATPLPLGSTTLIYNCVSPL
ncbi:MAG: hypothetical protein J0L82_01780 [Deltaproteobacteria bacterium]|nr:hypothetical protein [Deltaproteobacteria bacterium]